MSREIFMDVHDELAAELMEQRPDISETLAYALTEDAAYNGMRDRYADMIDRATDRHKERGYVQ